MISIESEHVLKALFNEALLLRSALKYPLPRPLVTVTPGLSHRQAKVFNLLVNPHTPSLLPLELRVLVD